MKGKQDFEDYFTDNEEELKELYLEEKFNEDDFVDWCYDRFISYDPSDDEYERRRDDNDIEQYEIARCKK